MQVQIPSIWETYFVTQHTKNHTGILTFNIPYHKLVY